MFMAAVLAWGSFATAEPGRTLLVGDTTFEVVATVEVPEAPHGICFSSDGEVAYVSCACADRIAVINAATHELVRELASGHVPLDVILATDGRALLATHFSADALRGVPVDGAEPSAHLPLRPGPSLFSPPTTRGRRFLVCEEADVVFELTPDGTAGRSWPTADRPYPADVTRDGILVFVPARDASAVTVIDTLNNRHVTDVPVGERPQGGAMTADDVSYVVACSGTNELRYINTASFEVTDTVSVDVGPRPFAVTMTRDGRFGIVNNAGGNTVSILDVAAKSIVGSLTVGEMPIVVRAHPDGEHIYVASEGNHTVSVIRATRAPARTPADTKTEVIVLGMIHSGQRTSERYGLDAVRDLVRAIDPDFICAEIPPNRLDKAAAQFRETGTITEPRVKVFPENVDVIFPLTREMQFVPVPTAGWTAQMNDYRRAALARIAQDPARAAQWAEHEAAMAAMDRAITAIDGDDNPRVIHTRAYDRLIEQGLWGPYNTYFNDDLGDGGWDNINAKHYALIARHLDTVRGRGRRVLITFGAAHKGWFLRKLRRRDDVTLLEVGPFLDAVQGQIP